MHKLGITVSINPTYKCNFDCHFCYLTPTQLKDGKYLDLNQLICRINEIEQYFDIRCVDVYGGEVALLDSEYLKSMISLFSSNTTNINFITNFSIVNEVFYDERLQVSVSWDGNIRRKSEKVFDNIKKFSRNVHILMLASNEMLNWSDQEIASIIELFNKTQNIKTVEIKPYSTNQANQYKVGFRQYEEFIKRWLSYNHNFLFVNRQRLEDVFKGITNSFSDDHIYINPNGDFCVLDFDTNDNEFFRSLNSVEEYFEWSSEEKRKIANNPFCSRCEYNGCCLSEHLRVVHDVKNSCNGYIELIKYYKKSICEKI